MPTINLRKYYPFLTEDRFVEVSDEVAEAFLLAEPFLHIRTFTEPLTDWRNQL